MKITFIGHASILIETDGITILSDPWWSGPCFGGQWWNYPPPAVAAVEGRKLDFIYVSHGHHDHLHPGTLRLLPRDAVVLVSSTGDLAPSVRELGFQVREIGPDEEAQLSRNARARLMPTQHGDTLLCVADGKEVCMNLNDALHSTPHDMQDTTIRKLRGFYPAIDYVFCGFGVASHFPNCYRIPGKDIAATAGRRQRYFNDQWARIAAGLAPRFAFPFAADVVFLENDLLQTNEPTHNTERPVEALRRNRAGFSGTAIDIAPGFQIADGQVTNDARRSPFSLARAQVELASEIERANRYARVQWSEVEEVGQLLSANVERCRGYFASFPHDYTCGIRFRNSPFGLAVAKRGQDLSVRAVRDFEAQTGDAQLIFTTRLPYLRWSLTTPYGNEIIFVGSGGLFEYRSRDQVPRAIHRELSVMIRQQDDPPVRSSPPRNVLVRTLKRWAKRALGLETVDPYDLEFWTVYRPSQ